MTHCPFNYCISIHFDPCMRMRFKKKLITNHLGTKYLRNGKIVMFKSLWVKTYFDELASQVGKL